jgi:multiple sugar transport system substrate-binding protein
MKGRIAIACVALLVCIVLVADWLQPKDRRQIVPPEREEVVFWHFWGGKDRDVVEQVVDRFNASQDKYFVRPVAMPGNNLDVKLFLSVAGNDPPDLINQDDPIIADWASRQALTPISELASEAELAELQSWLLPAAKRLGTYDGELYGLCNGLDVRAFYYNATWLKEEELTPPTTLAELDALAEKISPGNQSEPREFFGYLPDSRRLWAWGYVFGGEFYDPTTDQITANNPQVKSALAWMQGYSQKYGPTEVAAFRTGDQSLPGKSFPLLPLADDSTKGRYAVLMDGQWRTRDIEAFQADRKMRGIDAPEFGVCPLPPPPGGLSDAGWVNGNFFVVPKGAKNSVGAWEFMKFWAGFGSDQNAAEAAQTAAVGGWIPVSSHVSQQPEFEAFLHGNPLFAEFVRLSASDHQFPRPNIRGAALYDREIKAVGSEAMQFPQRQTDVMLEDVQRRVQNYRERRR